MLDGAGSRNDHLSIDTFHIHSYFCHDSRLGLWIPQETYEVYVGLINLIASRLKKTNE